MLLYETAKDYWTIARRFHANRTNPVMLPTAVRDMVRVQATCHSVAVLKRVNAFIALNQRGLRGDTPDPSGPKLA